MRNSSLSSIRIVGRYGCAAAMAVALALGGTVSVPLVLPQSHAAGAAAPVSTHRQLASYGTWRHSSRFGDVWVPRVSQGWRPYTDGRWMWTDDGWYWQSSEPFGWIVYHYGRWVLDDALGWVWISGDDWAPAWVVWRQGDQDVGWAPAPPAGPEVVVADSWWSFVPVVAIGAVSILPVLRPAADNVTIVRNTTIINENTIINDNTVPTTRVGNTVVPVNAGPALGRLPPDVEHSITAAKIAAPAKGLIGEAKLDASKGAALKTQAVEASKGAAGAPKPGGSASATEAKPNASAATKDGAAKEPGAAAAVKPGAPKQAAVPEQKPAQSAEKPAAKPEAKPGATAEKPEAAKPTSSAPSENRAAAKPEPKREAPAAKSAEKPVKPQAAVRHNTAVAKVATPAARPLAARQARPAAPKNKVASAKHAAPPVRHANAAPAGHAAKKRPQEQRQS